MLRLRVQTHGVHEEVTPFGRFQAVEWVETTGSTNVDLIARAQAEPHDPRVLLADHQTAGRGRRDRTWESPPAGGLAISLFVPWADSETAHLVPTCLGIAAVEAVRRVGHDAELKWPNDLVADGDKKLGGMLSSAVVVDGSFAGVVSGLGCNVSWPPAGSSELVAATSLAKLSGPTVDRFRLASALIEAFDNELSTARDAGAATTHARYRDRCRTLGQTVRVERGDSTLTGVATDIDPSGALLLDVDGIQHRVDVGDVVHLRPA